VGKLFVLANTVRNRTILLLFKCGLNIHRKELQLTDIKDLDAVVQQWGSHDFLAVLNPLFA
jgi:hypothetical protein